MAKNKIQRIDQEIAKVREKIAEYQEKLKTLEAQKTEDVYKRQDQGHQDGQAQDH